MPVALPSQEAIALSIDDGTRDDYKLVRLYYTWYSGWFYRHRLKMISDLLSDRHFSRVLEVGTGSGIFIKELLKHSDTMVGIDIHATYNGVRAMLEQEGVDQSRIDLQQGDIFDIPFGGETFDAVVCISVLEHFADPKPALMEMRRVVKPDGILALGFPAHTPMTDRLFRALGYDSRDIHPATHGAILAAIRAVLRTDKVRAFPLPQLPLYFACRATRES